VRANCSARERYRLEVDDFAALKSGVAVLHDEAHCAIGYAASARGIIFDAPWAVKLQAGAQRFGILSCPAARRKEGRFEGVERVDVEARVIPLAYFLHSSPPLPRRRVGVACVQLMRPTTVPSSSVSGISVLSSPSDTSAVMVTNRKPVLESLNIWPNMTGCRR